MHWTIFYSAALHCTAMHNLDLLYTVLNCTHCNEKVILNMHNKCILQKTNRRVCSHPRSWVELRWSNQWQWGKMLDCTHLQFTQRENSRKTFVLTLPNCLLQPSLHTLCKHDRLVQKLWTFTVKHYPCQALKGSPCLPKFSSAPQGHIFYSALYIHVSTKKLVLSSKAHSLKVNMEIVIFDMWHLLRGMQCKGRKREKLRL